MQVDNSNPFNSKKLVMQLVASICNIKPTKNCPLSPYLENYLSVLANNLTQQNDDFRLKEAVMHSLGNVAKLLSAKKNQHTLNNIEGLLQQYVYPELESQNPYLLARAC